MASSSSKGSKPRPKTSAKKNPVKAKAGSNKKAPKKSSAKPTAAAPDSTFSGFKPATFSFLRAFDANNEKSWFDANRADYDAHYIEPAKALVCALGPRLQKLSPELNYEPRVNGSIFRVNRDVRFSKDKTPYKPHIDLWFWHHERRSWNSPGCFFRLRPSEVILGVGMHVFDKEQLELYRAAVIDDKRGKALDKICSGLEKKGYVLGQAGRKTVPRGLDKDHPRASWLLHTGMSIAHEGKLPKEVSSGAFVGWCADHAKKLWPLNDWLLDVVQRGR